MIFITGDTHGNIDFQKLDDFAIKNKNLTKDDYMIIAGDAGIVWSEATLDVFSLMYSSLPFSILYIDGNHENFDILNSMDIEIWNGGKVHKITDHIIHLMRGQVFNICGLKFFTMGGATSIDKYMRREHISWWSDENISSLDMKEAHENLEKVDYKVDIIVTHSCSEDCLFYPNMRNKIYKFDAFRENKDLMYFQEKADYKMWYFGHYHIDAKIDDKRRALYNDIIRII